MLIFILLCSLSAQAQFLNMQPFGRSPGTNSATASNCSPMDTTNLVQWLTFDIDGSDASGNGNNITWHGGTPTFSTAVVSNGATFNGSEYGSFGPIATTGMTWTIMFWFKTTTVAPSFAAIYVDDPDTLGIFLFGNTIGFYNSGTEPSFGTININTWYHFAMVDNSGGSAYYINGVEDANAYSDGVNPSWNNIGGRSSAGTQYFSGQIDGLVYYTTAKTPADIANVYAAGLPGVLTPGTGCPQ